MLETERHQHLYQEWHGKESCYRSLDTSHRSRNRKKKDGPCYAPQTNSRYQKVERHSKEWMEGVSIVSIGSESSSLIGHEIPCIKRFVSDKKKTSLQIANYI